MAIKRPLKDKHTNQFVVNPNSKRQQKLRAKAQRESAAPQTATAASARPWRASADPVNPADSAGADGTRTLDGDAVPRSDDDFRDPLEAAASHVDDYFSPPIVESPPISPDNVFSGEDIGVDNKPDDSKSTSKRTRQKDKFMSEKAVGGIVMGWDAYVRFRHNWIANVPSGNERDSLMEIVKISDFEQKIMTNAMAEYMADSDFQLSPGEELALTLGSVLGMRIIAMEGILMAMKRKS